MQELFSRDGIGTQIVMESAGRFVTQQSTIWRYSGVDSPTGAARYSGTPFSRAAGDGNRPEFTIIQRDNTTIACAALYPFPEEKSWGNGLCGSSPGLRSSSRGEVLLERIAAQAKQSGLSKLFVLTTRSIHWFQERGFTPVDIDLLPESKKQLYNYQRKSKVLMADLG